MPCDRFVNKLVQSTAQGPTVMHHMCNCAGKMPGYADFFIWALLDTAKGFVPDPFKKQVGLQQWSARVKALPAVEKYLSSRPKVRDVSKWKV